MRHLRALQRAADQNDGNRAAGTRGYRDSARYVASVLRDAGWSVRLERFRFPWWSERSSFVRLAPGGRLRHGRDFRPVIYSGRGPAPTDRCAGGQRMRGGGACRDQRGRRGPRAAGRLPLPRQGGERRGRGRRGAPHRRPPRRGRSVGGHPGGAGSEPARADRSPRARHAARGRHPCAAPGGGDRAAARTERERGRAERGERGAGWSWRAAHLDSVPAGPGINDNGSGVAALLAIAALHRPAGARGADPARFLGRRGVRPVRLSPLRELARTCRAPRDRRLPEPRHGRLAERRPGRVLGHPDPPRARAAGRRIARLLRKRVRPAESTGGASDHVPFAEAGIPVGGVFTGASERGPGGRPRDPCYHLPCDRVPNVDTAVLVDLARATAATLATLSRQAK